MQRLLQLTPFLSDPITRLEFEQKREFKACFDSEVDSIFLQCDNLKDYVARSQKLLDAAASFLDNALFNQEEFKACFDFVFDLFFTKAFSVVVDYCNPEQNVRVSDSVWGQAEFILLSTWASNFERLVLKYDESKLDVFNVLDQGWFVDLMKVYSNAESEEIKRQISNLIALHINVRPEPCMLIEGPLQSAAIVDLMTIMNRNLERVFRTGSGPIATSLMTEIDFLPVLASFPKTYLEQMHSSFPIKHVVSVLNGFFEASKWIKLGCPVNDFQQICFNLSSPELIRASGAFDRAWEEGSKTVARVMGAHVHPLIQKVGDESWREGSVTEHLQHDVCHYYDHLKRWMVPDVFRNFFADTFDGYLRCYVKALLSAKARLPELNIDQTFFERAYADLGVIQDILMKYLEEEEEEKIHARIKVMITFVRMLACDYDDVRMVIPDFMSLATSTNINVGVLEKVTSALISAFVGVSNASADTQIP
jgi:hypothetical protein